MQSNQASIVGLPSNLMVTKAGLTGISGAATTFSTGGTKTFSVNGKAFTRAAFAGAATPTSDETTGATFVPITVNKGCAFVWGLDAGGNIKVSQGRLADLDSAGNFIVAPEFPTIKDTVTPFAYVIAKAGSTYAGTGFRHGTDNWNTTGMSFAVVDCLVLPNRPQTS